MILSAIAAMASNRVIGNANQLPWHIPEDLKFFKEKTKGRILIMGRKTFESLPGALPNRFHILVTRDLNFKPTSPKLTDRDYRVVSSLESAYKLAEKMLEPSHPLYRESFGEEVFIVGGAEIYRQSLKDIDKLYLTVIEKDFNGDTFFPEFSEKEFSLAERQDMDLADSIHISFRTYLNKKD